MTTKELEPLSKWLFEELPKKERNKILIRFGIVTALTNIHLFIILIKNKLFKK